MFIWLIILDCKRFDINFYGMVTFKKERFICIKLLTNIFFYILLLQFYIRKLSYGAVHDGDVLWITVDGNMWGAFVCVPAHSEAVRCILNLSRLFFKLYRCNAKVISAMFSINIRYLFLIRPDYRIFCVLRCLLHLIVAVASHQLQLSCILSWLFVSKISLQCLITARLHCKHVKDGV